MTRGDHDVFEHGDPVLQRGATLRGARLAYTTYGTLAADRRNAVVYPTWYSGRHRENEWLIGPGMALDPSRWFITIPNMLGNGLSSSPSNTLPPYDRARFPEVTVHDNVEAQHRLVTQQFGIEHLACVTGWSMGSGQTFQWAVSHPEMVSKILPSCGSARTSEHNRVFLEGVKAALTADDAFQGGSYDRQPTKGLRAAARVYAGWGFSQAFHWERVHRQLGSPPWRTSWSVSGRASSSTTGTRTTCSPCSGPGSRATSARHRTSTATSVGRWRRSLRGPSSCRPRGTCTSRRRTRYEVSRVPNAGLRVIPGVWGHVAGGGANPEDPAFIDRALAELLAE